MSILINYWYIFVALIVVICVGIYHIYVFSHLDTAKKTAKIREWLIYAVAKAEEELGSGTGVLKLRYVYDMAIEKFPNIIKIISFDKFSALVDLALEKFKAYLEDKKEKEEK